MRRFDSPVLREVAAKLHFIDPKHIIVGRGESLVAWGVRASHKGSDIDIVMPEEDMNEVERVLGWKAIQLAVEYTGSDLPVDLTRIVSPDKRYDIYPHEFVSIWFNETGRGRVYPNQLIAEFSEQDEETRIHVANPAFTRLTMQNSLRQKDIDTIPQIDEYLERLKQKNANHKPLAKRSKFCYNM